MQFRLTFAKERERLVAAETRLRPVYPLPPVLRRYSPIDQLVNSILGSRTRSEVSMAALHRLKRVYGDWNAVRDAPYKAILNHVSETTFPDSKAEFLRACLRQLTDANGNVSLDRLDTMSTAEAMTYLETLPGVGRKVSASTLNASTLQRRALVIDTRHLRILKRLGWVSPRANYKQTYDRIMPHVPDDWSAADIDDHHRRFKRLGQEYCRHTERFCEICPLITLCRTGQNSKLTPEFALNPIDP